MLPTMRLFLESFGFLIAIAGYVLWVAVLTTRYPLPIKDVNETRTKWLSRFCETYPGAPCRQMKFFLWSSVIGTLIFTVANYSGGIAQVIRP